MSAPSGPSLLGHIVGSRRLRIFFVISVLLHLLAAALLLADRDLRDWVLGANRDPTKPVETGAEAVQRAVATLAALQRERFEQAARRLTAIDGELRGIAEARLNSVRRLDAAVAAAGATAGAIRRLDAEPPALPPVSLPTDLAAVELAALYRLLPPLELACGRAYERVHALGLALVPTDPIPVAQAVANTRLQLPERRDIDAAALAGSITSAIDGRLDAYRAALTAAHLEALDMVQTAERWLALARGAAQVEALEMVGESYKHIPKPVAYYGHYLNPKLLQRVDLKRLIVPPVALGDHLGPLARATSADWVAIDRWYVIGPFSHPGATRRLEDLERSYPPETTIDLDATYTGKDGRELRWKYRRFGTADLEGGIRIEPYSRDNQAYAVWYFYAEFRSEQAGRVLASFCSDDYGVAWLNGRRVFQSPPTPRPWMPFTRESFRAVDVQPGINRVLFKLENGKGATGFSAIFMTAPDPELISLVEQP
jgi:hypothetical protein